MSNEAMRRFSIAVVIVLLSISAYAQDIEKVLMSSPTESAEIAFALGDVSFLMVPICFDGIPAWKSNKPPKNEKHIWKSCEEMIGYEQYQKLQSLEEWAKKYNKHLSKLLEQ